MCAIDALGIAPMLSTSVVISSADPGTGQAITVAVPASGHSVWDPASAVVFAGRQDCGDDPRAPAARECCGVVNFFASQATATAWADRHPDVTGTILGHGDAERLGAQIFGPLLDGTRAPWPDTARRVGAPGFRGVL